MPSTTRGGSISRPNSARPVSYTHLNALVCVRVFSSVLSAFCKVNFSPLLCSTYTRSFGSVSYTHLDVYKRQSCTGVTPWVWLPSTKGPRSLSRSGSRWVRPRLPYAKSNSLRLPSKMCIRDRLFISFPSQSGKTDCFPMGYFQQYHLFDVGLGVLN